MEAGGGGGGGSVGGASVGGGRVGTGSGVFVGGAGVAVLVGVGVMVAVAVGVFVGVAVFVGCGVAVAVSVGVAVGGTAVFVSVTALIASVANSPTLAVAADVGGAFSLKEAEPFTTTVIAKPIRPVIPMTISESKIRFLMVTTPDKEIDNRLSY